MPSFTFEGQGRTTGGGSPLGLLVLALVVILVAAVAGGVIEGVAEGVAAVVKFAIEALTAMVALAVVFVAGVVAYRWRHPDVRLLHRFVPPPVVVRPAPEAVRAAPQRPAIEQPQQHIHFHGVSPADVADILRQHQQP